MTPMNSLDKPPILRFLVLLLGLILVALGLASLSSSDEVSPEPGTPSGVPTQGAEMPSTDRATDSATSMPSTPADMIPPA